jgi:hypothetical protein
MEKSYNIKPRVIEWEVYDKDVEYLYSEGDGYFASNVQVEEYTVRYEAVITSIEQFMLIVMANHHKTCYRFKGTDTWMTKWAMLKRLSSIKNKCSITDKYIVRETTERYVMDTNQYHLKKYYK